MQKQTLLYEGKAKKLYTTNDDRYLISEFKDSLTAFNGEKRETKKGKGALNNRISTLLFSYLNVHRVPTHYIKMLDENRMLHKRAQTIPIEVIVRNIAAGSLCRNLGFKEGQKLDFALIEFDYKNDALGDPKINDEHALLLGLVEDRGELEYIRALAKKINKLLCALFDGVGLNVVDFKLEFGKDMEGNIILIDELSPDNFRLWDKQSGESMDKDRFRQEKGGLIEAYEEVLKRLETTLTQKDSQ